LTLVRGTVVRDGLAAGAAAAVVSGAPSTLWALAAGRDPLEATLAAGSILLPRETRRGRLVAAAGPVHLVLSLSWAVVLARSLPRRRCVEAGAVAGLAIAAFDLGVVGRRFPRLRALPTLPQLADHALYGATVGFVLERRRRAIIQT
jgi:drug/metabolite transporter superfamily protein YnfA